MAQSGQTNAGHQSAQYLEVLNGAIVWRSLNGASPQHTDHSLNILNFEASSMTMAQQAATINFEDKLLACKSVPNQLQKDWLVLVSMQEVALMELCSPHGL